MWNWHGVKVGLELGKCWDIARAHRLLTCFFKILHYILRTTRQCKFFLCRKIEIKSIAIFSVILFLKLKVP